MTAKKTNNTIKKISGVEKATAAVVEKLSREGYSVQVRDISVWDDTEMRGTFLTDDAIPFRGGFTVVFDLVVKNQYEPTSAAVESVKYHWSV